MQYGRGEGLDAVLDSGKTRGDETMTMTKARTILHAVALAALTLPTMAAADCPPADWTGDQLKQLKAEGFKLDDDARRAQLANGLLGCLSDPDPELRDGIAFEAWSTWLRSDKISVETRLAAVAELLTALQADAPDPNGFRKPFAALVLSELARVDRKSSYLSPEQRAQLLEGGAAYLEGVRDYRGFDAREGWRHGVAHGADLMLQLALNPALDKPQLDRMIAAVATQVTPPGEQFYVYGESARLARPVLYTALRGLHSAADWDAFFSKLSDPAPLAKWPDAFRDNAGLARRHNARAFLLVVYSEIADSKDEKLIQMLPAVKAAMAVVP